MLTSWNIRFTCLRIPEFINKLPTNFHSIVLREDLYMKHFITNPINVVNHWSFSCMKITMILLYENNDAIIMFWLCQTLLYISSQLHGGYVRRSILLSPMATNTVHKLMHLTVQCPLISFLTPPNCLQTYPLSPPGHNPVSSRSWPITRYKPNLFPCCCPINQL